MKQLSLLGILFLFIISCSTNENNMQLSGTVKGLKEGTLLLQKVEDTSLVTLDSVQIQGDASFQFSATIESPEMYYLYLRLKDGTLSQDRIAFFAEPGEVSVTTSLKKFGTDAKITGSENQAKLEEYDKIMQRYADKNLDLMQQTLEARQKGNDSLAAMLKQQQERITGSRYLATVNYAINHKEMEVAPYLALAEIYNANIKYLDTIYKELTPQVKESMYGKKLETFITNRKASE